jgi:hypothetical protein
MVSGAQTLGTVGAMLFAAEHSAEPVLEQLDGPRRAAVIMALLGLTLVGLFLITFVMVGGHWVRKLARHRPGRRRFSTGEMAENRLHEALQNILPEMKSNDTVLLDSSSKDTKVES